MTATRTTASSLAVSITILMATTVASAQPMGPSIVDLPPVTGVPTVRTADSIEAELAAMDSALAAALKNAPLDQSNTGPVRTPPIGGTPLGAPAPVQSATALINADREPRPARGGLTQTVLALAGVLMLVVGLSWIYRRIARASGGLSGSLGAGGRAPAGVLEVLARYPLAARHTLVVLRFDRRVLLCSMTGGSRASGAGMTVLCQLDDPEDIASVLIKTRDEAGESIARSFERSLRDAERSADDSFEQATIRVNRPSNTPAEARNAYASAAVGGGGARTTAGASGLRRGLESLWTGGKR